MRIFSFAGLTLLAALPFAPVGCEDDLRTTLRTYGFTVDDVDISVKMLGKLSDEALQERLARGDIDAVQRLGDGACEGRCRFAEVSLYIKNTTSQRIAPPVVRVSAPSQRARRPALSLRHEEISAGRTGRIRALVELWPEERELDMRLSASVFVEVQGAVDGVDDVTKAPQAAP